MTDDVAQTVKLLIEDIRNLRQRKIRKGIKTAMQSAADGDPPSMIKINRIGSMEIDQMRGSSTCARLFPSSRFSHDFTSPSARYDVNEMQGCFSMRFLIFIRSRSTLKVSRKKPDGQARAGRGDSGAGLPLPVVLRPRLDQRIGGKLR